MIRIVWIVLGALLCVRNTNMFLYPYSYHTYTLTHKHITVGRCKENGNVGKREYEDDVVENVERREVGDTEEKEYVNDTITK